METFLSLIEPFLWLALALPAVTDDFFTNLALMLIAPVIVVVGGLLVTEYLRAGMAIKIPLAVISFGFFVSGFFVSGAFMSGVVLSAFKSSAETETLAQARTSAAAHAVFLMTFHPH